MATLDSVWPSTKNIGINSSNQWCFGPLHRKGERRKGFARGSSLLLSDAFKVQSRTKVMDRLSKVDIKSVVVPKNMTHLHQPLNLSTNAAFKKYKKRAFSEYVSAGVMEARKNNTAFDALAIKVDLRISALKSITPKLWQMYTSIWAQTKGKQ